MLVRYGRTEKGKTVALAQIYTKEEHHINPALIDREALKIIHRLESSGHEAYIVGGAVRDLLSNKTPKDFDIATDALPRVIKQLFRNSRIIGKRFRLVHIFYGDKIIEVSTFRSTTPEDGKEDSIYGTLEEDVKRRDFSINALYYSPSDGYVIDYAGGFRDIKNRKMHSLIKLNKTFIEDPVRLIRAVKYSVNTGCAMPFLMRRALRRYAPELKRCPHSRLTEEVFKILQCGNSRTIMENLARYDLLGYMLPVISGLIREKSGKDAFLESLGQLDERISLDENLPRWEMLAALVEPLLVIPKDYPPGSSVFGEGYKELKKLIAPITPPNRDVELALRSICKKRKIKTFRKGKVRGRQDDSGKEAGRRDGPYKKRRRPPVRKKPVRQEGPESL